MRERVFLFGDVASRPDGLERALARAGFALADGPAADPALAPDLALLAVRNAGAELEHAMGTFHTEPWSGVPVIVLLAGAERDGIARALALGAADALAAPIDLGELGARLQSRLRSRAELRRAAGAGALHTDLFLAIEEIAAARRPEEMLEALVRRLGDVLGASHCACLAPSPDRRHARLVAVHENPTLRGVSVDLFRYPEAVEAAVTGRVVHAREVLRDGLFLAHLAQWPDSPEVHEIESSAAVPLVSHGLVRAILVVRTRRGDPALTPTQVASIEHLVHATGALLEREERRNQLARRREAPAGVDPVTGCLDPDTLDQRLREEIERVRRYGGGLSFVLLEADAPRELLGRQGSEAADRFYAEFARLLFEEVRAPDLVARYGGDKFGILLPATGVDGARRLLSRLATRLESLPLPDLVQHRPRLAAGLLAFPHAGLTGAEDLLVAAEAALQRGKASGGDRVGVAA